MASYTSVTIIYNPNSTGSGEQSAKELRAKLKVAMPNLPTKIVATKYAGHAEELAYRYAKATKQPLVISASGDGGYHEVINGLIKAQHEGANPVAGLLPAGNANDHFNSLHKSDVIGAIQKKHEQKIDVLKLSTTRNKMPFERYAHSYIGIGLTPQAGKELNKIKLNWFNQAWVILRVIFMLRPVRINVGGKISAYDSVIFSNVGTMSKVLRISDEASVKDGRFEVTTFRRRNKINLIATLLRASVTGMPNARQTKRFKLKTIKNTLFQLDGEITTIDANSSVDVTIEQGALRCIV